MGENKPSTPQVISTTPAHQDLSQNKAFKELKTTVEKLKKNIPQCSACDGVGSAMTQKEYTFTERPLGLAIKNVDNKVVVYKMHNPGCLRQGIVEGSQLLSVNKLRWGDPSHVFTKGSVTQETKTAQLPIKISFKCPVRSRKCRTCGGAGVLPSPPQDISQNPSFKALKTTVQRLDKNVPEDICRNIKDIQAAVQLLTSKKSTPQCQTCRFTPGFVCGTPCTECNI